MARTSRAAVGTGAAALGAMAALIACCSLPLAKVGRVCEPPGPPHPD